MVAAVVGVECEGFIESYFSLMVRMKISPLEVAIRQSPQFATYASGSVE
jgi:hypothetical protein